MAADDPLATLYQVLDEMAGEARVPAGATGRLHRAIFALRERRAPAEQVALAEQASIAALRLEWALRKRDADQLESLRAALRDLRERLLDSRVAGGPNELAA